MGNEQSGIRRNKSNIREQSPQGIELQDFSQNRGSPSRTEGVRGRNSNVLSGININDPQQQTHTVAANTPEQKLELVRTKLKEKLKEKDFKYGDGSDCGQLMEWTLELARENGIKAKKKEESGSMLVKMGRIQGDARESNTNNTEGEKMWSFKQHFWCEIEGIVYDPLFDRDGPVNIDKESSSGRYREFLVSKFESNKFMVHAEEHYGIKCDTVFQSEDQARAFVDKVREDYPSSEEE